MKPRRVVDNLAFLRRVSLDTMGRIPTTDEIADFLDLPSDSWRNQTIERFFSAPGWADHWVAH